MRGVLSAAAIAACAALALAPPALGQDILNDFRRNGTINPCQYSDNQLRRGLQGLPPDIQQYAPGLADQLSAGREGCGSGGGGGQQSADGPAAAGGGSGGGPAAKPEIRVPAPPAPEAKVRRRLADIETPTVATTAARSETPAWLAPVLAAVALLVVLASLMWFSGWSPGRFTRPLRAAFGDAAGRSADALAELRESVRLGR